MELLHTITESPGLPSLFILSFLSATILPIGSEWLLAILIFKGISPAHVVITASIGNFLGACTTYVIGLWGSNFFIRTLLRIDDRQLCRAEKIYGKYGVWSLFFSWLPMVGDPLCLLAGLFRVGFYRFSIIVFIGKFFRYATLALIIPT